MQGLSLFGDSILSETKYTAGRSILAFCGFVGWVVVAACVVIAFLSIDGRTLPEFFLSFGLSGAVSGLFLVLICQVATAIFDQSEAQSQSLEVLKLMAEKQGVDLSSLEVSKKEVESEAVYNPNITTREDGAIVRQYMGREIVNIGKHYYVEEYKFSTLGKAQRAINEKRI